MENPEAPKRRGWSIVRKAQIIGALIGAIGTTTFNLIGDIVHDPHDFSWAGIILIFIDLPTWLILKLFGQESLLSPDQGRGVILPYFLLGLVNALLLFFVGTFIGLLIQKLKRKN